MLNHQTLGGPESRDDRQLVTLVLVHVAFWVQHQEVKGGVIILLLLLRCRASWLLLQVNHQRWEV